MRCHAMRCQAMILVDAILRDGFARRCQTMRWYGTANEIKAMTIGCIVRRLAIVAMFPTIFPSLKLRACNLGRMLVSFSVCIAIV